MIHFLLLFFGEKTSDKKNYNLYIVNDL